MTGVDGISTESVSPLTERLRAWQQSGGGERLDSDLIEAIYGELRVIAAQRLARESAAALTPTELVHEIWMRLKPTAEPIGDRNGFLRLASVAMRHLLVDQARERAAHKRQAVMHTLTLPLFDGGHHESLDDDQLIDLDRSLAQMAMAHPRIAEAVSLRAFAGLDLAEVADVLDVSLATAKRDLAFGRAWLRVALGQVD